MYGDNTEDKSEHVYLIFFNQNNPFKTKNANLFLSTLEKAIFVENWTRSEPRTNRIFFSVLRRGLSI